MFQLGASLDIKLKQKMPKSKSKKIYNTIYVRSLDKGKSVHLYHVESGLYVCSIYMKPMEWIYSWIDTNIHKIGERVDRVRDTYPSTNDTKKKQQTIIFS